MTKSKTQISNESQNPKSKIWNFEIWISFGIWILAFGFFCFGSAEAKPTKGFHKGPYFTLQGGVLHFTADNNARTGDKVGRDFEPVFGFNFGWNINDCVAPEIQARYSTNKNNDNREHIVNANLNIVYTPVFGFLTDFKTIRILPFLQGGLATQFASVPGDPLSNDRKITIWGPGFGIGGGLRLLFKHYVYAGVLAQADFISLPEKKQDINGADTTIINGGWNIEPSFLGMLGVHF